MILRNELRAWIKTKLRAAHISGMFVESERTLFNLLKYVNDNFFYQGKSSGMSLKTSEQLSQDNASTLTAVIAEKDAVLAEKDALLTEKDAMLAEKEVALAKNEAAIDELQVVRERLGKFFDP